MKLGWTLLLVTGLLFSPGCAREQQAAHDHAHDDHGHAHEGDAHGSVIPSRDFTAYTPKTELFAEHRYLLAGLETRFAAHLTDMRDGSPVAEGRLEAALVAPDGREEVFVADGPTTPGIFQPVVKAQAPGTYRLRFRLTSPRLTDTIEAGTVTVYADAEAARAAAPSEEEPTEAITFTKEQQWKLPFETRPVEARALESGVTLQGVVKPASGQEAAITSPVDGRVVIGQGRQPRLGDRVGAGALLAVVTPTEESSMDRVALRQEVKTAEATHKQARLDYERAQRLHQAQAVPGKRVEEARTALAIAQARLDSARHHLRAKEASLSGAAVVTEESFRITSPIAGTVVEAGLIPGAHVEEGATLYRLIDMRRVWVEARVSETDVNRVAGARKAEITVAGHPTVTVGNGQGGLVAVGSVLDPNSRTAPVVYAVPNPDGALRIGMTATVRALTGASKVTPVIPQSAVVDDNGQPIAYVQTGGERFFRRALTLGVKQGERVQVLSGLKEGERVVTQGGYEMRLSTLSNAVPAHGHEH